MSGQRDMFAAFQAYDKNGDGTLTADELMGILLNPRTGTPMTLSDAEEFVAYADTNGERNGSGRASNRAAAIYRHPHGCCCC